MIRAMNGRVMCLAILLFGLLFHVQLVDAKEGINQPNYINFTITYRDKNKGIEGACFSIYKIGTIDENGAVACTSAFKNYPVKLNGKTQEQWNDYAETLKGYVFRDRLNSDKSGITNQDGEGSFQLEKGLYLVVGDDRIVGDATYQTIPFIVALPERDPSTGKILEKSMAYPKYRKEERPKKNTSLDVLKIWEDKGNENNRPRSIDVELLKDGTAIEAVTLSEKNNWSHVWKDLDGSCAWDVVEKNVNAKEYVVKVKKTGTHVVITNQIEPKLVPSKKPKTPTKPGSTTSTSYKKPPRIPQTGQLWWPVYTLAAIGILCIFMGFLKQKRQEGIDEK